MFHVKPESFCNNITMGKIYFVILMILLMLYYLIQINIILDNMTDKENFTSKFKALKKGKSYLEQCLKGKLINQIKCHISNFPKIDFIISLYNTG